MVQHSVYLDPLPTHALIAHVGGDTGIDQVVGEHLVSD